jgi:hydroxyethylthiazole kinase-like uncharacterized protein yjeF
MPQALLTPDEMYRADALAVDAGITSLSLMENAGRAVAEEIVRRFGSRSTLVLCGPGNNGGDGYVTARYLRQWGWPVRLARLGRPAKTGDAAKMADRWQGPEEQGLDLSGVELLVDAIYGAGLSRDFPEDWATAIRDAHCPVVAVDLPSGLDGGSGRPRGTSLWADLTVTFFCLKPGHVLMPGRERCGETIVADIGIPPAVLDQIRPRAFINDDIETRAPAASGHKYHRGHAVVVSGGPLQTGAARLAAEAALRTGSGLVTLSGSRDALAVHAAHVTAIMLSDEQLGHLLADRRRNAVCIGPAAGLGPETCNKVETVLLSGAAAVLDADALTSFAGSSERLWRLIAQLPGRAVVLTPHDGEFKRIFNTIPLESLSKIEAARMAAVQSGAVVVLKGADTVIAAPDGRVRVNVNAPPSLATAGSGDVLAGIVTGLLAQGMDGFAAASAAVWRHGAAGARLAGRSTTAEMILASL